MAEGVTFTKRSDAVEYRDAASVGGTVVSVDRDGDGEPDGYIVKPPPGIEEGPTRGPNPSELGSPQEAADQKDYLERLEAAGAPGAPEEKNKVAVDELGYRQGGMNFNNRGPVKYSVGGAVKGKNYRGSF